MIEFDTEAFRWKAAQRREIGRLGCLLGEVLFFRERRAAGWSLPTLPIEDGHETKEEVYP